MVSFLQGKVFTVSTFLSSNASLNRSGGPFIWFGKLNTSWGIQNHVGFKLEFLCTVPSAFPGPQGIYLNEKNVRKWWNKYPEISPEKNWQAERFSLYWNPSLRLCNVSAHSALNWGHRAALCKWYRRSGLTQQEPTNRVRSGMEQL